MVMTTNLNKPLGIRGSIFGPPEDLQRLRDLVSFYGIVHVAKASDTSVQSIAKALSGLRLLESTQRRIRTALR